VGPKRTPDFLLRSTRQDRMKFANATKLDRKSGGSEVEGSAVLLN
jgi:hypothetical protein